MGSAQETSPIERQLGIASGCFWETVFYITPPLIVINALTQSKQIKSLTDSVVYFTYCVLKEELISRSDANLISYIAVSSSANVVSKIATGTSIEVRNLPSSLSSSIAYTLSYKYLPLEFASIMTALIELGIECTFSKCSNGFLSAWTFGLTTLINDLPTLLGYIDSSDQEPCINSVQNPHITYVESAGCSHLDFNPSY